MADILIRSVQFPTMAQAYKTLIVSYDGKVYEGVCPQPTAKKKESIAHAVKLPEHGDLISKPALFDEVFKVWGVEYAESDCNMLMDLINDAPVIVPADKEETE